MHALMQVCQQKKQNGAQTPVDALAQVPHKTVLDTKEH